MSCFLGLITNMRIVLFLLLLSSEASGIITQIFGIYLLVCTEIAITSTPVTTLSGSGQCAYNVGIRTSNTISQKLKKGF